MLTQIRHFFKEGAKAPASGRSLAGVSGKNIKRVLAGAGNGRSQLAGATMINFTQEGAEAPASGWSLDGAWPELVVAGRSWRKKYKKGLVFWPVAPAMLQPLAGSSAPSSFSSRALI